MAAQYDNCSQQIENKDEADEEEEKEAEKEEAEKANEGNVMRMKDIIGQ